jgi:putative oxidoreductase
VNIALLALHVGVGLLFAGHGAQKLFGAFGGHGLEGTAGFFDSIGMKPGRLNAIAAGAAEFFGGLLIALGLVTPFAAAALIAVMTVAVLTVHAKNGIWSTNQGYEYNLVLVLSLLVVAAGDAGRYSLDHWFGWALGSTAWGLGALGVGIAGGLVAIAAGKIASRERSARRRGHGGPAHPTAA